MDDLDGPLPTDLTTINDSIAKIVTPTEIWHRTLCCWVPISYDID